MIEQQTCEPDLFALACRMIDANLQPKAALVAGDLKYAALSLGDDLGPYVREEMVRRPWISMAEAVRDVTASIGFTEIIAGDARDDAYEEGNDEGIKERNKDVLAMLCPPDANEETLRNCVESIRAEVT